MHPFRALLIGCLVWLAPLAHAQPTEPVTLRVGAVLSLTGANAPVGRAQEAALRAWEASAQSEGLTAEILTLDDGSRPERAAALSAQLASEGIHALLCCSNAASLERALPTAREAGTLALALAPSDLVKDTSQNYWLFSIVPEHSAQLETVALSENALAFMGLASSEGDIAVSSLSGAGARLVAQERYAPDVDVLTPEALWIATRQPGAVLVWGRMRDTQLAVDALSQRGFAGRTYIKPQLYEDASVLGRADLRGTFTVTNAVSVGDTLPLTHPTYAETRRFVSALGATYGANRPTAEGGYAWDAMTLLRRAFEQTLAYSRLEPENTTAIRQALRDSLVGLGPVTGAVGVYDYRETDHVGVAPDSLVIAVIERGRLRAAR